MVNNEWNLDVTIVPVGLSYENIIKFKSEVTIKYGLPIKLADLKDDYIKDEIRTVKMVTNKIRKNINNDFVFDYVYVTHSTDTRRLPFCVHFFSRETISLSLTL